VIPLLFVLAGTLVSLAALFLFVQHAGRSIRVTGIIDRVGDLLDLLEEAVRREVEEDPDLEAALAPDGLGIGGGADVVSAPLRTVRAG
jgi:uncharacterized membrane protein